MNAVVKPYRRVSVIVPFHKQKDKLDKCLENLNKSSLAPANIRVVDDSETGNGFTNSVNEGIKKEIEENKGIDYFLVLNQDCYLEPDCLSNLVNFMDATPKCFMAGVKQISSFDKDRIIHGGTGPCFPNGIHEVGFVSRGDCTKNKQVPWVNGACFIVRAEALVCVGLMHPCYKMFGSDADWGYEARSRGFECWYVADAVAVHEQGASQGMDLAMARTFESDMRFFRDRWITDDLYRDLALETFA